MFSVCEEPEDASNFLNSLLEYSIVEQQHRQYDRSPITASGYGLQCCRCTVERPKTVVSSTTSSFYCTCYSTNDTEELVTEMHGTDALVRHRRSKEDDITISSI